MTDEAAQAQTPPAITLPEPSWRIDIADFTAVPQAFGPGLGPISRVVGALHYQDYKGYCGPACLQMLVQHAHGDQGVSKNQTEIYQEIQAVGPTPSDWFSTPEGLCGALNHRLPARSNLDFKPVRGGPQFLGPLIENSLHRRQPIICIKDGEKHWVLATGIEQDADGEWYFRYADPSRGGSQGGDAELPDEVSQPIIHEPAVSVAHPTCQQCNIPINSTSSAGVYRFAYAGQELLATVTYALLPEDGTPVPPSAKEVPAPGADKVPEVENVGPCPPCDCSGHAECNCGTGSDCCNGSAPPLPPLEDCHGQCCSDVAPHATVAERIGKVQTDTAMEAALFTQIGTSDAVSAAKEKAGKILGDDTIDELEFCYPVATQFAALPHYWLMSWQCTKPLMRVLAVVNPQTGKLRECALARGNWPKFVSHNDVDLRTAIKNSLITWKPTLGGEPNYKIHRKLFWIPSLECPNPYLPAYRVEVTIPETGQPYFGYAVARRGKAKMTWEFIPTLNTRPGA